MTTTRLSRATAKKLENGALLPINQNMALFALIGTTFCGDGQTTFGLPDLTKNLHILSGNGYYCIAVQGVFPNRN